jgi:hypothetical protein
MRPEQPQHPLATHLDAVLPTQPSPDLAVALTGERRILQHPADQPDQLHIADRGRQPGPYSQFGRIDPTGIDG